MYSSVKQLCLSGSRGFPKKPSIWPKLLLSGLAFFKGNMDVCAISR